jgi:molybdate transport system substrate-binding protein
MRRRSLFMSILAVVSLALASPLSAARAADNALTIFAAASMKGALDDVAKLYEAKTGTKVAISFAASSALAKQIEAAAPADIFISADLKWMSYLVDKDAVKKEAVVKDRKSVV